MEGALAPACLSSSWSSDELAARSRVSRAGGRESQRRLRLQRSYGEQLRPLRHIACLARSASPPWASWWEQRAGAVMRRGCAFPNGGPRHPRDVLSALSHGGGGRGGGARLTALTPSRRRLPPPSLRLLAGCRCEYGPRPGIVLFCCGPRLRVVPFTLIPFCKRVPPAVRRLYPSSGYCDGNERQAAPPSSPVLWTA